MFIKTDLLQYKTHNVIIVSALKSVTLKLDSFLTLFSKIVAETGLQCLKSQIFNHFTVTNFFNTVHKSIVLLFQCTKFPILFFGSHLHIISRR